MAEGIVDQEGPRAARRQFVIGFSGLYLKVYLQLEFSLGIIIVHIPIKDRALLKLIFFVVHFGGMLMALVWCWSSTALPSLRESYTGTLLEITKNEEMWIASMAFVNIGTYFLNSNKLVANKSICF